ncbi:MAG: DUF349 domain-containing protein [Anaerorhabdus sp.]
MDKLNEEYLEPSDLDKDIATRRELIEQAKAIDFEANDKDIFKTVNDLRKKWKRISYWESALEEELSAEFDGYIDVYFAKRRENYKSNQDEKEKIIEEANRILKMDKLSSATKEMNNLMEQWKLVPSAGREIDDELWAKFNEVRQSFYDKKAKHWEEMQVKFLEAKKIKLSLIEEVKELMDNDDFSKVSSEFNKIMKKWKDAGSAGHESEEELWSEFNEYRQSFYSRKEEYNKHMRSVENEHYTRKREIVEAAKEIFESGLFSRENTQQMKQWGTYWRTIGFAGRGKDEQIWKEFRSVMDDYFDALKDNNQQRHQDYLDRLKETKLRKQELIASQKNQLNRMQEDKVGMISEKALNELDEDMEYKREFISQLEKELEELEVKIAEQ